MAEHAGAVLAEGRICASARRSAGEDDVLDQRLEGSRETRDLYLLGR